MYPTSSKPSCPALKMGEGASVPSLPQHTQHKIYGCPYRGWVYFRRSRRVRLALNPPQTVCMLYTIHKKCKTSRNRPAFIHGSCYSATLEMTDVPGQSRGETAHGLEHFGGRNQQERLNLPHKKQRTIKSMCVYKEGRGAYSLLTRSL